MTIKLALYGDRLVVIQSLFHSLNAMHPQLLSQIENQGQSKGWQNCVTLKLRTVEVCVCRLL